MPTKTKTKLYIAAAMLIVGGFFVAERTLAQASIGFPANFAGLSSQDLKDTIENIVRIVLGFVGIVFLLLILFAGFLWMTSQGEEDKINRAKKIIVSAVIGLILTLSAYAIAKFIIDAVVGGTSGGGGSSSSSSGGPGSFGFALGSGALESHYPGRNAKNVPRNTNIFVTFKEEIDPDSLCDVGSGRVRIGSVQVVDIANRVGDATVGDQNDGVPADPADDDNTLDNIACATTDNFTFKLNPDANLGNTTGNVQYRVILTSAIEKFADGSEALPLNYSWNFWVSNVVDETPPIVTSVYPAPPPAAFNRNVVVQVNFSEPVDPTTISGVTPGFNSITLTDAGAPIDGSYISSNQYQTTEFFSNAQCGVNSCGGITYCLPGPRPAIEGRVKGTGPQPVFDMAGNVLDGDNNFDPADATTEGGDYVWTFGTTGDLDLDEPFIINRDPRSGELDVDVMDPLIVDFNERMSASTLRSRYIGLSIGFDDDINFWVSKAEQDMDPGAATVIGTRASIHHDPFRPLTPYHPGASNYLTDLYQNCFEPPNCTPLYGGTC